MSSLLSAISERFKRGFFISRDEEYLVEGWGHVEVFGYHLQYDKLNDFGLCQDNSSFVLILGTVFDVGDLSQDIDSISKKLHSIVNDSAAFFDAIDRLNGRFFIMFKSTKSQVFLMNDACGLRSVFYIINDTVSLASHPQILADIFRQNKNGFQKHLTEFSAYHLPGNVTNFENIYQLIPNHHIGLSDGLITRFFPRVGIERKNEEHDVSIVREKLALYLKEQVGFLVSKYKILCSITAGIDSRITLSATRDFKDKIKYFTYYSGKGKYNDILDTDRLVVQDLVSNLQLDHDFFEIPTDSESINGLRNKLLSESHLTHNVNIAAEFIERYSGKGYTHLRSNLLEIGRNFYRKGHGIKKEGISLSDALVCYSSKPASDEVKRCFEEFFSIYKYENLPAGYDPYDMFYWEYRMGVWHSLILLESDLSFETLVLFNSRYFIELLLSLPSYIRDDNDFFLDICKENWKILDYWGINNSECIGDIYSTDLLQCGRLLKLEGAKVFSGSVESERCPEFMVKRRSNSMSFNLVDSNPRLGDFVKMELDVNLKPNKGSRLVLNVRTPYANGNNFGRLSYSIFLNDQLVCSKDVSEWPEVNSVVIPLRIGSNRLEIKIEAIKNCEPWSWGKAGKVVLDRLTII